MYIKCNALNLNWVCTRFILGKSLSSQSAIYTTISVYCIAYISILSVQTSSTQLLNNFMHIYKSYMELYDFVKVAIPQEWSWLVPNSPDRMNGWIMFHTDFFILYLRLDSERWFFCFLYVCKTGLLWRQK